MQSPSGCGLRLLCSTPALSPFLLSPKLVSMSEVVAWAPHAGSDGEMKGAPLFSRHGVLFPSTPACEFSLSG